MQASTLHVGHKKTVCIHMFQSCAAAGPAYTGLGGSHLTATHCDWSH